MKLTKIMSLVVLIAISFNAQSALILNSDGLVSSISGIEANNTIYQVDFIDGTCFELFEECDSEIDFIFESEAQALAAGTAMLQQLNDYGAPLIAGGALNGEPGGVGCNLVGSCEYVIPYQLVGLDGVEVVVVQNQTGDTPDSIFGAAFHISDFNTGAFDFYTYAVFSETNVPAPINFGMFLVGLLFLVYGSRNGE